MVGIDAENVNAEVVIWRLPPFAEIETIGEDSEGPVTVGIDTGIVMDEGLS